MNHVKEYSANIAGLRNKNKRQTVLKNFKKLNHDFFLLQEKHLNKTENLRLTQEWNASAFFSVGDVRTRGTAILCANHIYETILQHNDKNGNYKIIATKVNEQKILIINIFATSGHRLQYLSKVGFLITGFYIHLYIYLQIFCHNLYIHIYICLFVFCFFSPVVLS